MKEKGATLIELVVIVVIFFMFTITLAIPLFIRISQIGEGEHNGYITAVDQRGYIFKNYDVYFKTDNSSSQEDIYCINRSNLELIDKAKEANKERKQVILHYKGVRGFGLGLCEGTEIQDIEEL